MTTSVAVAMSKPTAAATFRFVQLSDPHLTSLDKVRWTQLLSKRLLSYISWRRKRRDEHRSEVLEALHKDLQQQDYAHLVVTGDLTHISLPDEFIQARAWLESLGDAEDISVIPGNHDALVALPAAQGLGHWAAFMGSDVERPDMAADEVFPSLRVRGPVAFIGVSTAVPSAPLFATGRVGKQQRQQLARLLDWAAERGLCRVVMIHHPPITGLEKRRKRLTDVAAVEALLKQHGAELVLHGHCHRPMENYLDEAAQLPVLGLPSASSVHPMPGRTAQYYIYHLTELAQGWQLTVKVRGYCLQEGLFKPLHEMQYNLAKPHSLN